MIDLLSYRRIQRFAIVALCIAVGFAVAPAHAKRDVLPPGIEWRMVNSDADVDKAFADAKSQNKPLFLYWGAVWCPPCNVVKASIFTRRDFQEASKNFVSVYLDGDGRGAQKLASKYKVSAYPTMVLFKPDGSEITRLPGEVEAQKYVDTLTAGVSGTRRVKELLDQAQSANAARLSREEWRLLAYYSWDTDQQQLIAKGALPATLERIAKACPKAFAESSRRLQLKAVASLADAAVADRAKTADAAELKTYAELVQQVLTDPALTREHFDSVTNDVKDIVNVLTAKNSDARKALAAQWATALDRLMNDANVSRSERADVLYARVQLAKVDDDKAALPEPLKAQIKSIALRTNTETTDKYERQAIVPALGYTLAQAGLFDDADALVKAGLPTALSPHYYMSTLASIAKMRGDKVAAVDWSEKSFNASEGAATRVQWGASYVTALVQMAPQEAPRIEKAVAAIVSGLEATPETFYQRNERSLRRIGTELHAWNKDGAHKEIVARSQRRLSEVCAKLPAKDAARATCDSLFKAPEAKRAA